jgi:hypothetical protein
MHRLYRHYRRIRIFLAIVWRPDDVSRVSVRTAWRVSKILWGD